MDRVTVLVKDRNKYDNLLFGGFPSSLEKLFISFFLHVDRYRPVWRGYFYVRLIFPFDTILVFLLPQEGEVTLLAIRVPVITCSSECYDFVERIRFIC
jgi:hypothetical protein